MNLFSTLHFQQYRKASWLYPPRQCTFMKKITSHPSKQKQGPKQLNMFKMKNQVRTKQWGRRRVTGKSNQGNKDNSRGQMKSPPRLFRCIRPPKGGQRRCRAAGACRREFQSCGTTTEGALSLDPTRRSSISDTRRRRSIQKSKTTGSFPTLKRFLEWFC